jgi:hypothetical protein
MLYLLAAIGLATIVALLWRAFAPVRVGAGANRRLTAPDDDPDFLRRLGEQNQGGDDRPGDAD